MKLNQKVRYGVGCLYELSKKANEYIDADHIAENQKIPKSYAHKVLQTLANNGYVFAHKGKGYKLARPLEDITAYEIIELLTADIDPNASNPELGVILEKKINETLGHITLAELIKSINKAA